MVADDVDVVAGAAAVGLVCDHHLRSDHGDRRASRAGGMMRGDTERIMREGPRQALMEAMANLYRVYTSPNRAEDYEEAFKARG